MGERVAVLGAGGKMGFRVSGKLQRAGYDLRAVEIGEPGRARLRAAGIEPADLDDALRDAAAVVLAIPDSAIAQVAAEIVPRLDPGTIVVILDAAAPYAGVLPERADITYFVGHPCHPPLYAHDLTDPDQRADVHGGVAPQSIVCALMQGPEEHYDRGRAICEAMWSPIIRTHRVTLEQLAILEPGLSEMVAMAFIDAMTEALDECVERYGIPREAAFDFLIGHINVETSMWFGFTPKVPSDAALRLMRFAKSVVLQPDWRQALSPAKVREASELIARG
ncbi:phosphogluconate dehydrogenase C-terminal domain-containing protein [Rubellimicrobium sp. CFH 75288]|uniref:phosphogluconate dehydrogenase C-terminal domain-containing protein n=1 Tax=Rubellimicrobium sp. CFH 75288 TaxID=2697034 RepID=UPI001412D0C2|nr:phosphogluconate dehydrogenase C-terminal domain-containing protein [Rubellimicrobium sp. CFH 75288]NAZ35750.1 NAD(P)-binding domain-containing protein [Rubellimicrobium sp. CFH 75288]